LDYDKVLLSFENLHVLGISCIIIFIFLELDDMKIFNEDLEKHLLCDDLSFESYGRLCFIFTIVGIYVTGTIDGLLTKQFMNHYPSNSIF